MGFPGGPVVKNLPHSVRDTSSIPCLEGSHMHHDPGASTLEPRVTTTEPKYYTTDARAPKACALQQEAPPQ